MGDDSGEAVIAALSRLNRRSRWTVAKLIPLGFACYHTQGLTSVDDRLFLSSVEITQAPEMFAGLVNGYDRSPGAGTAHLFELDRNGQLRGHLTLGEGTIYHPGGIDYDGERYLWVPAAEYRPDSRAIVYRIDMHTMEAVEAFRFPDHLGGIVYDRASRLLHAVTWGSRRLVTFTTTGEVVHQVTNKSHLVDFQGCITVHDGGVVCTGIAEYHIDSATVFQLGSAAVIDTNTGYIRLEVPVTALSPSGRVLTYNAVHFEVSDDRLRMLAADDGINGSPANLILVETQASS